MEASCAPHLKHHVSASSEPNSIVFGQFASFSADGSVIFGRRSSSGHQEQNFVIVPATWPRERLREQKLGSSEPQKSDFSRENCALAPASADVKTPIFCGKSRHRRRSVGIAASASSERQQRQGASAAAPRAEFRHCLSRLRDLEVEVSTQKSDFLR